MPPPQLSSPSPQAEAFTAVPWIPTSSSTADSPPQLSDARADDTCLSGLSSSDLSDSGVSSQPPSATHIHSSRSRSRTRNDDPSLAPKPPILGDQGWGLDDDDDDQSDHGVALGNYSPSTHLDNFVDSMHGEDGDSPSFLPSTGHNDIMGLVISAASMPSPANLDASLPETVYYPVGLPDDDDDGNESLADPDYMDVVSMLNNNHDVQMDGDEHGFGVAHPHQQFQPTITSPVSPPSLPPLGDISGEYLAAPELPHFPSPGAPSPGHLAATTSTLADVYHMDEMDYQAAMNIVGLGSTQPVTWLHPLPGPGQSPGPPFYAAMFEHLLTGGNPLVSTNMGLENFVFRWARQGRSSSRSNGGHRNRVPRIDSASDQWARDDLHVEYKDLMGDKCDMQGVDWNVMGVTRNEARERRLLTYHNFVNTNGADIWRPNLPDVVLPKTDDFFRFRRMEIQKTTHLAHFQLRNLTACTSRSQVFYTGRGVVHQYDPISRKTEIALSHHENTEVPISTIDAAHGILVSGNFNGEYVVRRVKGDHEGEEQKQTWGTLTTSQSAITNHVQVERPRRSNDPHAYFASNDAGFRVLNVATDTIVHETMFPFPINCSAVSPDGQLRVMVGDHQDVLVVPADGGRIQVRTRANQRPGEGGGVNIEPEQTLRAHRDHGFACAWADDGWTVATGYQDRTVTVWDARNWRRPLTSIRTEMAGCRSLRFSPAGSGQRVLVAAEEADFVNIIDARKFETKQTVDVFSEIGGVAFEPEQGRELFVFLPDSTRGGILQLERCADVNGCAEELDQYRRGPLQAIEVQEREEACDEEDLGLSRLVWPGSYGRYRGRGHISKRPWDRGAGVERATDAAAPPYDWPQENMDFSTRWSRQARARRRKPNIALDGLVFF